MIGHYQIIGKVLFSQSLRDIRQQLQALKKDQFDPLDRILIQQDSDDQYPYVDAVGSKLIEIQKIINQVDISNCFVLLITANADIAREIAFITKYYSVDPEPMQFHIVDGVYSKTVPRYKNTACRKLWDHLYVGTDGNVNPCCVADHRFPLGNIDTDNINDIVEFRAQEIRSNMLQGYRHRACAICYEKEDQGIRSARQVHEPHGEVVQIRDLDIRLNNICNFKCRMCNEYFSSAIQQETIELYGQDAVLGFEKISLQRPTKQLLDQRLEKVLLLVNRDLRSIYFAGGEPLLTREHYEILDRLIDQGNTDLTIRYNTNLSTLSYKQWNVIDRWCHFSDVTVGASIDASGAVAEYMRHGTVWTDIEANIATIKQDAPHVKLQITSTVSGLTIENLIDLQHTWIDQGIFDVDDFEIQVLTSPNFLSPAVLPQNHKDRLSDLIRKHIQRLHGTGLAKQWQEMLQWMNVNDYSHALKDFSHRMHVLDAYRKESFVSVFPQYQDLL